MEKAKIDRINELARKAKAEGLTASETAERDLLRKEYLKAVRTNMRATLDNVVIEETDGSLTPLKKKTGGHLHDENCSCGCHHHHHEEEIPEQ